MLVSAEGIHYCVEFNYGITLSLFHSEGTTYCIHALVRIISVAKRLVGSFLS